MKAGETVVISGVGGIGVHAVQIARHLGARVIAIDVTAEKLELARQNRTEHALDARRDPVRAVQELTAGKGADVALDFTGLPQAVATAAAVLKKGGRLVMVGYQVDTDLTVATQTMVIRELEV